MFLSIPKTTVENAGKEKSEIGVQKMVEKSIFVVTRS